MGRLTQRWQNDLEGGEAEFLGESSNGKPRDAFFSQQGERELANLPLPQTFSGGGLHGSVLFVSTFKNLRGLYNYVRFRLRGVHPNPGPHRHDKEARKENRKRNRRQKREVEIQQIARKTDMKIVTWNVQRMSLGTRNKRKAGQVAEVARKEEWEVILLSEIRAESEGVEWIGTGDEIIAIIHSQKAGILLRGEMLQKWRDEKQRKLFSERTVSIKVEGKTFISTYQPVCYQNNKEERDLAKEDLKSHKEWASSGDIIIIGGDFNAQIGREENIPGICGKFGIRQSNEQGRELLLFCEENGLAYCNSFYNHYKRGTWYNNFNGFWYELDGFIMPSEQRHRNVKKIYTHNNLAISDHKPKVMVFKNKIKKYSIGNKRLRAPRIKFENLKDETVQLEFKSALNEKIEEIEEDDIRNKWDKIAEVLVETAKETCGVDEKKPVNPWLVGKELEIEEMSNQVTEAINRRNDVNTRIREGEDNLEDNLNECKEGVKRARKTLKRSLQRWEKEWWEEILNECKEAGEKGDSRTMYQSLKKLGLRDIVRAAPTTTITMEGFRDQFKQVSETRYENRPEDIEKYLDEVEDISMTEKATYWREQLNEIPSSEEVFAQMKHMKDSAPGKDGVRLDFIRKGGEGLKQEIVKLVQFMFENSAESWEESLKIGLVIPLHKKGDINNPNNYRGVCLLPMASRILARIMADRMRIWAEDMDLMDDEQAGFRKQRSTADGAQIMIRINEDSDDLRKRKTLAGEDIREDDMPAARLLDLRKAYPRVNRPALWSILRKYGVGGNFLRALQDLHEGTEYSIKSKGNMSESWLPLRGLREGCPSSPILFNIYHQVPMRTATLKRKREAEENNEEMGLVFCYVPGNNIPGSKLWEKYNSECKRRKVDKSLFADDTVPVGKKAELERGLVIIKEEMSKVEERNNDDKEEELIFGTDEGDMIRMLGSYIGQKEDLKQRKKRAGHSWFKLKKRLKNSRLSRRIQARIIEAVIESTILFDCQVRVWYAGDIKQLQQQVDKMYRYVWSSKNKPPLVQMQEAHKNMQDVRNELKIKSIRSKIEKRVLQRIGHVVRMDDTRLVKNVTLGWLEDLEGYDKVKGKKRKTVLYWKKVLKEAGFDYTNIGVECGDRKEWKSKVRERIKHIEEWERRGGNQFENEERGQRNIPPPPTDLECSYCGKVCASKAGLINHVRRIHETTKDKKEFKCNICDQNFKSEGNLKNHKKSCIAPQATDPNKRRCACGKEISKANFKRHVDKCNQGAVQDVQARVHRPSQGECDRCGAVMEKANISRHKQSDACGRAFP